ncbi:MAG: 16S rRNA (cytidine(1402)-2'-O)-methyltransferase [Peptococcaceae bacterium]|jgi:16S rRNA (cytidine1402-2'-O)-methyltransferase|nr:16S rRNA (cytidine(1402)-2'-O)-methyltransferase [Peptococcaceae bacterium]
MLERGTLYVCATPIGNLADVTFRVLDVLRKADLIAAEDTRHSRKLLQHYDIHTPMVSYHEHNEKSRALELLAKLQAGLAVALISDAGTPGISDPGYVIVNLCREHGLPVDVLPGPNAAVTALILSGLPADRFAFLGFCQGKISERRRRVEEYAQIPMTHIYYEAPHRLAALLAEMAKVYGERPAAVVREISKLHQQVHQGTLPELAAEFALQRPRGECCIVVGAYAKQSRLGTPDEWRAAAEKKIERGIPSSVAMKETAQEFDVSKRAVYQAVLDGKKKEDVASS